MRFSFAWCWLVVCGALAGWLVAGLVPAGLRAPHLHRGDFLLVRPADRPLEVSDARWCLLPSQFADFDLHMDVELGEATDLDVLLRQVEPRLVDDELLPFHGRFAVLRLTTANEGPAWRSRDEALAGGRGGGVTLAAGQRATVWIEGRGRLLRANVAGKTSPWFTADDEYGMCTLVARGGKAVVHNLTITNRGQPRAWTWSRWFWAGLGALGGLLLAAIAGAQGDIGRTSFHGVLAPLIAWLFVRQAATDLGWPDRAAMACVLAASLFAALTWLRTWRFWCALAAVLLLVSSASTRLERDTAFADAWFGPRAGSQLSEAYAQLVRGPGGLHDAGQPGKRVFLLGGQLLYDRGQPAEHLELQLATALRAATRQPVVVPCLPTVDGHAQQQWRLFTRFFTGYRPAVIVLGVGRGEDAYDEATGRPRSHRAQLVATIRAAREHCAANGAKLVLFAEAGLTPELLLAVKDSEQDGVPLVVAADGEAPGPIAGRLVAVIAPLLRP